MGKIDVSEKLRRIIFSTGLFIFALSSLFMTGCTELEKPQTSTYYAETAPPAKQEFRWSNGRMPKTFDPATASAPPETDIVRAIFDGLTELDARTLEATPAIAEKWSATPDNKVWTFTLRKNAKWSNGKPVTAQEFVASWKRVAEMGASAPRGDLLKNIAGLPVKAPEPVAATTSEPNIFLNQLRPPPPPATPNSNTATAQTAPKPSPEAAATPKDGTKPAVPEVKFGVEAKDDLTLVVTLIKPDPHFPRLAASPVFRPIYDGSQFEAGKLRADIVTNGAFRISSTGADGVTMDRAEHYWNRAAVHLERVRFVPKDTAEQALAAYKAGELDAVTNANFEPLALKLLAPYGDFRQTKHGALNFYEFNTERPPFNDRRVREALAISIERERLTEGDMEGASRPALSFLPFEAADEPKLVQNVEKAKELLSEAGFTDGENFPVIRLLVNRNDTQQRIAKSVARMWKQNLNLETEISVKDTAEFETSRGAGDYDIVRRGVVLPTSDETANMLAIFPQKQPDPAEEKLILPGKEVFAIPQMADNAPPAEPATPGENPIPADGGKPPILNDEDAMRDLAAIPLYFPLSYSLVKSYVQGFETNSLDAPSLKDVRINMNWQPEKPKNES